MISRIHNKLGTAGLVVAIVALVAALTGVAYAAQGLNSKQKKEVKKIAKKFAGKPGPAGPAGPQGPAGPAGKDGANGTNGTNGADGKSVTSTAIASGGVCGAATGVKYTLNGVSTNVCNGEDGETGFTETLPPGETETGAWGIAQHAGIVSLSFNIPMAEAPTALHYINLAGEEQTAGVFDPPDPTPDNCLGEAEDPTAPAGHVCVYAADEEFASFPGYLTNVFKTGATFFFNVVEGEGRAAGTWAATAATP